MVCKERRFRLTASYSLLLVQKRVTREKHTPCTGRAMPDYPALLATLGGCGTRAPRSGALRQSSPTAPSVAPLLGGASGAPERPPLNSHRSQYLRCIGPMAAVLNSKLAVLIYRGWVPFPVGDAEKRSGLRGSRRALSEGAQRPSCAAAEDREHRRAVAVLS